MRKLALLFLLFSFAFNVSAQEYDTLKLGDRLPGLYYWDTNWIDNYKGHDIGYTSFPQHIIARYCETSTPLKVIGIAGAVDWIYNPVPEGTDELAEDYFQLLLPAGDTLVLLGQTRMDTCNIRHMFQLQSITPGGDFSKYMPLHEAYLPEPIIVRDSFYVSCTANCLEALFMNHPSPRDVHHWYFQLYGPFCGDRYETIALPYPTYYRGRLKWLHENLVYQPLDTFWHVYNTRYFIPFFPIYDTTYLVGVTQPMIEQNTMLFPNPTNGKATLFSSFNIRHIEIYNINGTLLDERRINATTTEIDLSDYPKGTYLVTIHTAAGTITKQIVKQ